MRSSLPDATKRALILRLVAEQDQADVDQLIAEAEQHLREL